MKVTLKENLTFQKIKEVIGFMLEQRIYVDGC